MPDALSQPLPEDLTKLQATVTFTFEAWNVGQEKTPEEMAKSFQASYSFDQEGLADALSRSLDHEVKVEPVEESNGSEKTT